MQVTFKVTVDLGADGDHVIDEDDRKELLDAIMDALDQRYQNGFDLAGCFVEGFYVKQEGFTEGYLSFPADR